MDHRVLLEQWDQQLLIIVEQIRDDPELMDHRDLKVNQDLMDHLVNLDCVDRLDDKAAREIQAEKVHPEYREYQELPEDPAKLVFAETEVHPVDPEQLEKWEDLAQLDLLEIKDHQDHQDLADQPVIQETPALECLMPVSIKLKI